MQKTQALSLGQEGPLEKEMTTRSSILASETPWTEEPGRLWSPELQRVGLDLNKNNDNNVLKNRKAL